MFVDAFALAAHFTRPLVISTRRLNGNVESSVATYVLLNGDGWFLTAGHVFSLWRDFRAAHRGGQRPSRRGSRDPGRSVAQR